jgi:ABC-2 type transport system permease protein
MLRSIYGKALWDRRVSTVWWMIGVAALTVMTVAFYPLIESQEEAYETLLEGYPEEMAGFLGLDQISDLFAPVGYINSQIYGNTLPILLFILAIGMGTAAIAGEEDRRTMDLLLAQPVQRRDVVLQKFAAMVTIVFVVVLVVFVLLLVSNPLLDLELSFEGMLAVNVAAGLLGLLFGALALALGAWNGRRGLAIGLSAGIATLSFFLYGLAPLVDALEPFGKMSPFYWYLEPNPLANGFDPMLLWMVAFTALFVGISVWGFVRRDVAV